MDVQFDFKVPVGLSGQDEWGPTDQVFGTSKCLLSAYCVPGAVPGAGNKTDKNPASREIDIKQKNVI